MFLGKTLYSQNVLLLPGVLIRTGAFNAGGNPAMD